MTKDELTGKDGLLRQLTSRFYDSYGMSCRDIQRHLQEVYGVRISAELISPVTESVMLDVKQWQNRPLEKSYPILFLDALRVNCRQDGRTINKALYVALAINWEGKKEVLGLWLSENEGAKFWLGVLNAIKTRGTERHPDCLSWMDLPAFLMR